MEEAEEEMKAPKPMEAMNSKQESATECKSLSLTSKKATFHSETPPRHQTMDLSNREEPRQDGNGKSVDLMEANMVRVITSVNEVALKEYQMKLSIHKKDDIETIVSINCFIMQMEWGMEVHIYNTLWMNLHDGINLTL